MVEPLPPRVVAQLKARAAKKPKDTPPGEVAPEAQRRSTVRALSGLIAQKMIDDNAPKPGPAKH